MAAPPLPLATVHDRLRAEAQAVEGCIDAHVVQRALGLRSLYLAQRLLVALSGPKRSFESAQDFIDAAEEVMAAPLPGKIDFLFRLHDADGDGYISASELERLLHIAAAEHGLRLADAEIDELVAAVMRAGDANGDGKIGLIEFIEMLLARPSMEQRLTAYGVSLLMPGERSRKESLAPGAPLIGWLRNDLPRVLWTLGIVLANLALFASAFWHHANRGAPVPVQIARGFGACLNFDAALIAVPMLRTTLMRLRRSPVGHLLPIDDAIALHALIGELVFFTALGHSAAHAWNVTLGNAPLGSRANLTGLVMLVALAVLWAFARERVRRSRRFELFWITHLGYVLIVGLAFLHAPHFWLWGTVPWLWFATERALRTVRRRKTRVLAADPLPTGVTRLTLERPLAFAYAPGDYVFLRLPAIAKHEWHPFTLTSAPEDPEHLTVHVRSMGNWSSAAGERMPELVQSGSDVVAHVDGPYATCSREILASPHAVAFAGGIGVTPFASILESLLLRGNDREVRAPIRKLHFVWLCNDQSSFEWFRDLLAELERRDYQRRLDMHVFMTAGRSDMASDLLNFARSLVQRHGDGTDLVTGLRARTGLGAPDIDRLLESFCDAPNLPRPEVFFCGPKALEELVSKSSRRLGLRMRSERF